MEFVLLLFVVGLVIGAFFLAGNLFRRQQTKDAEALAREMGPANQRRVAEGNLAKLKLEVARVGRRIEWLRKEEEAEAQQAIPQREGG